MTSEPPFSRGSSDAEWRKKRPAKRHRVLPGYVADDDDNATLALVERPETTFRADILATVDLNGRNSFPVCLLGYDSSKQLVYGDSIKTGSCKYCFKFNGRATRYRKGVPGLKTCP